MDHFHDDDAGYLAWLQADPRGYVVNTPTSPSRSYLMLHKASCWTISKLQTNAKQWTSGQYSKQCADNLAELDHWARQTLGGVLKPCGLCKP
jgi:hypothetical protein